MFFPQCKLCNAQRAAEVFLRLGKVRFGKTENSQIPENPREMLGSRLIQGMGTEGFKVGLERIPLVPAPNILRISKSRVDDDGN